MPVTMKDILSAVAALRDFKDPTMEVLKISGKLGENVKRVRGILRRKNFERENLEGDVLLVEIGGEIEEFKLETLCGFRLLERRDLMEIIFRLEKRILQMKEVEIRAASTPTRQKLTKEQYLKKEVKMEYLKNPLTEDGLRQACSDNSDNGPSIIFLEKSDGQRFNGVVREIYQDWFSLLQFTHERKSIGYGDVSSWVILSKIDLAKEVAILQAECEYLKEQIESYR